jgi:hypothetical protein
VLLDKNMFPSAFLSCLCWRCAGSLRSVAFGDLKYESYAVLELLETANIVPVSKRVSKMAKQASRACLICSCRTGVILHEIAVIFDSGRTLRSV